MDNKLSELSKPRAFVVTGGTLYQDRAFTDKSTAERSKVDRHDRAVVEPLYSQEYVSALQRESAVNWEAAASLNVENEELKRTLEAKDKRIDELECANQSQDDHINQQQDRIDSLEKKNSDLGSALGSTEKQLVYSRDAMATWERKAISNFEECAKMSQCIEELEKRLATPVRLSKTLWYEHDDLPHEIPVLEKKKVVASIRAAGFTVEGGEQ